MQELITNEHSEKRAAWFKIIEDYNSSGMSQVGYCRQHNINKDHFAYYLSRWRIKSTDVKPVAFVKMQVVEPMRTNKWVLNVANGISLEVPPNVSMQQLAALVINLRTSTC
jgi:hypothetical protein